MYTLLTLIGPDHWIFVDTFATEDSAKRYADLFLAGGYKIVPEGQELRVLDDNVIPDCPVIDLAARRAKKQQANHVE